MTITTSSLLYAFLIGVLFYVLPGKARKYLLALASVAYIFKLDFYSGVVVLITSVFTWGFALVIDYFCAREEIKKALQMTYFVAAFFVAWVCAFKYLPKYTGRAEQVLLPIGFSFYMFQSLSYVIDVKRQTVKAERNIFNVILFLTFFPKYVSGPIERFANFNNTVNRLEEVKLNDRPRFKSAQYYIIYGIFMKLVIADRLALYVDKIFEGYEQFGFIILIAGIIGYTFQIYCDFAGYSYVAIGISKLFGIELVTNFNVPYCSENITEFWRRWHISLSSWLRDYVYIPLGGNRYGTARKILNTMTVFLICGMWHGAGFNYVAWGLLHGTFSAIDSILKSKGISYGRKGISGRVITFLSVALAWVFFKATSFSSSIKYLMAIFKNGTGSNNMSVQIDNLGLNSVEIILIVVLIIVQIILDIIAYKSKNNIPTLFAGESTGRRYIILYLLLLVIFIFGVYGPNMSIRPIYMQF